MKRQISKRSTMKHLKMKGGGEEYGEEDYGEGEYGEEEYGEEGHDKEGIWDEEAVDDEEPVTESVEPTIYSAEELEWYAMNGIVPRSFSPSPAPSSTTSQAPVSGQPWLPE